LRAVNNRPYMFFRSISQIRTAPKASLLEGVAERSESKISMLAGGKHTATNRWHGKAVTEGVTPPTPANVISVPVGADTIRPKPADT